MGIYMGDLILGTILQYMVSASFSCFMVGKGLKGPFLVKPKLFPLTTSYFNLCLQSLSTWWHLRLVKFLTTNRKR